jgi:hypothetical protein
MQRFVSLADRLTDIDHGAANRDGDVPRQLPSAVSYTWYANNLSDGAIRYSRTMAATLVGYCRSTDAQDLTAQQQLRELGVTEGPPGMHWQDLPWPWGTRPTSARPGCDQPGACLSGA